MARRLRKIRPAGLKVTGHHGASIPGGEQRIDENKVNVEKLRALIQPYGAEKLQAAEERHRAVIDQLKPKSKDNKPRLADRSSATSGRERSTWRPGEWSGEGR